VGEKQEKSSPSLSGLRRPFGEAYTQRAFSLLDLRAFPSGLSGIQEADPAMTIGRGSGEGRPDCPSVEESMEVMTKGAPVLGGGTQGPEKLHAALELAPWL